MAGAWAVDHWYYRHQIQNAVDGKDTWGTRFFGFTPKRVKSFQPNWIQRRFGQSG